jgi:hypothetical protein
MRCAHVSTADNEDSQRPCVPKHCVFAPSGFAIASLS